MELLHIYAQELNHDEAFIVGNKEGLLRLKEAIDKALNEEAYLSRNVFVSDGEGYNVVVICNDKEPQDDTWQNLILPYTNEMYHFGDDQKYPSDLLGENLEKIRNQYKIYEEEDRKKLANQDSKA